MKICPNCRAEVEDNFELCWNCNYSFSENKIVDIDYKEFNNNGRNIACLRCLVAMEYSGEYKFHEGTRIGVLGELFELFQNREKFDLYTCPKCGKVEFFMPMR